MLYEGIDHVVLPVSDVAAAAQPFERLGLVVSPTGRNEARGTAFRQIPVGGPDNLFCVELLGLATPEAAPRTPVGQWIGSVADQGLAAVALRVAGMGAALDELSRRGVEAVPETIRAADGTMLAQLAVLLLPPDAATGLVLIEYARSQAERHAALAAHGEHALPVKRLDHLAAVAPDLERSCRYWEEVLGVPVAGEVVSPTTVVRQLRIGDAVFELLGPATPDSPIRQRRPGLASMCSFEVADLAAAVAHARAAGFTIPDPAKGTLPGTLTATIPGAETSGLNVQLLQYVS